MRIRLTGTSSTLPESVRGTSAIWRISSGTWRGEQSSRMRARIAADELVVELARRRGARRRAACSPSVAVARHVDDERVDDLVEREHGAVDLARCPCARRRG